MDNRVFIHFRKILGKTQAQMANLLGISTKAVSSFEQGWRDIPFYVERQILFLMVQKHTDGGRIPTCWEETDCPVKRRAKCPAWEFNTPNLCWLINGTMCNGVVHKNWQEKMKHCWHCKVLRRQLPPPVGLSK